MKIRNMDDAGTGQLPIFPDLMVLVPDDGATGGFIIDKIPPWLAAMAATTLDEAEGSGIGETLDPVTRAFGAIARDVLKDGIPVEDYNIEFNDMFGNARTFSLNAQRITGYVAVHKPAVAGDPSNPGQAVLIRMRDISSLVKKVREREKPFKFHGIVGRSEAIRNVFEKIEVYGPADAPVVITGETGTGKELVARALHACSGRRGGSFVAVNCSAINEDLFESELFGHERGSFTGAVRAHKGRFERAHMGTLFLDEIGDMPARTQAKLLRVLETGTIERVGGEKELPVDIRLLAATNIPLERAVAQKRFRADLYHRISVFRIHVAPLRERPEDIQVLVHHFLELLNRRYKSNITRITPDALRLLELYYWPGNVRELRNVLERVYVETQGSVIGRNVFKEWIRERDYLSAGAWNIERLEDQKALSKAIIPGDAMTKSTPFNKFPGKEHEPGSGMRDDRSSTGRAGEGNYQTLDAEYIISKPRSRKRKQLTPELMARAYADADGNISLASSLLGIHKATFYRGMQKYELSREELEKLSERSAQPARNHE